MKIGTDSEQLSEPVDLKLKSILKKLFLGRLVFDTSRGECLWKFLRNLSKSTFFRCSRYPPKFVGVIMSNHMYRVRFFKFLKNLKNLTRYMWFDIITPTDFGALFTRKFFIWTIQCESGSELTSLFFTRILEYLLKFFTYF